MVWHHIGFAWLQDLSDRQLYHILKEYKASEVLDPTAEVLQDLETNLGHELRGGPPEQKLLQPCWGHPKNKDVGAAIVDVPGSMRTPVRLCCIYSCHCTIELVVSLCQGLA